jgi:lipoyl synthase
MGISLNHLVVAGGGADAAPADRAGRKPSWLKMKMPGGEGYLSLLNLVNEQRLHTVCQSARCPNMGECWAAGTATLMILGDVCTRSCGFCHIATGRPPTLDLDEPVRVGKAVAMMGLRHTVITSVNRDELSDGGAAVWAETIKQIRLQAPGTNIEVLIPDFAGDWEALQKVLDQRPEILNHNIETVPRLYKQVRPQAKYRRSLELLKIARGQGFITKTGMMLGLGEQEQEIEAVLDDLVAIGCQILTLGQYLQPTPGHLPVIRWVHPDEFANWKRRGEERGIRHVEAGPLVRSSYHAEKQVAAHGAFGTSGSSKADLPPRRDPLRGPETSPTRRAC